jgi:ABC-type transporter Mla MlaB component
MVAMTRVQDSEGASGVLIVDFDQPEDLASLAGLKTEADEVRLNFEHMTHIGSAALTELIKFCTEMRLLQKRVVIEQVPPDILEVFQLTRFVRIATVRGADSPVEPGPRRVRFFGRAR